MSVCFREGPIGAWLLMLLPQGIVGLRYLLSFHWSNAPYAKGDKKASIEAPSLSTWRIGPALIMAADEILPGHSQSGTFRSKTDNSTVAFSYRRILIGQPG